MENDDGSRVSYATDIKSAEFWSWLETSRWSSHTEELWYSETICMWMTIYIYTFIGLFSDIISYLGQRSVLDVKHLLYIASITWLFHLSIPLESFQVVVLCLLDITAWVLMLPVNLAMCPASVITSFYSVVSLRWMMHREESGLNIFIQHQYPVAQSTGAVEYTDCFSAER